MTGDRLANRHDFHESYYDHSCAITETKDVLKTDIKGSNTWCHLKRWWHGLFLLSYSDERSGTYYMSSHAIKMERIRQFRGFRERIHPLSKFRNIWDCFIFIIFILDIMAFHHNASIIFGHISSFFYYLGAAIELIIIADICVNLRSGYIDQENRKIVLDKFEGLMHYGSTKLFLHVASAIPLHWLIILRYGTNYDCSLCKTNKFIGTLKLLSTFRLLRLYETSYYLTRKRVNYKLTHFLRFLRICILCSFTLFQFMDLSDMFAVLSMISAGEVDHKYHLLDTIISKYAHNNQNHKIVIYNILRVSKAIIMYKFDLKTKYYFDQITTLITFAILNIFHFWVLIEFYSFISRIQFVEDMVIVKQNTTQNLLSSRQLPEFLNRKLKKYFEFSQAKMKVIEGQNGLLKSLPPILKKEIFRAVYFRLVARIPCFFEWPSRVVEEIVDLMKEEIYLRNDMVAEPAVPNEGLLVVATGELAVYAQNGKETGHLIDGDFFGELSLVTDNELRTSSVVALSPCVILMLDKWIFRRYMRYLPGLFHVMEKRLREQVKK